MTAVAVAGPNQLAADAGGAMVDAGGNAVDAAVAAALVACSTEPGICSLGGGAYVTLWPAEGRATTFDGNVEMPGRGLAAERFGKGYFEITTGYGGGVTMSIGYGAVATPGALAALGEAHDRHGRAPWREVVAPAIDVIRRGFPLGTASDYYLDYVHRDLYGWHPASHAVLHHADGSRLMAGDVVQLPDLVDTLRCLAEDGWRSAYVGDVGHAVADDVQANGGLLTRQDLAGYRAVEREPLGVEVGDWQLATNPPPAVGGSTMVAMLKLLHGASLDDAAGVLRMVDVMDAVLGYRVREYDGAPDPETVLGVLLELADEDLAALQALAERAGGLGTSPSTVHVSVVDGDGGACAITASAGYGSGVMVPGTGLWLNNCLGEHELNVRGVHALPVGTRLPSNMAPTVGRRDDGAVLAIGSPGADRITTAIVQTMARMAGGASMADAIAAPRVHVAHPDRVPLVHHEADVPLPAVGRATQEHHATSMFFGGVGATLRHADGRMEAAADPRRAGGTAVAGVAS